MSTEKSSEGCLDLQTLPTGMVSIPCDIFADADGANQRRTWRPSLLLRLRRSFPRPRVGSVHFARR